ncbi:DUF1592 domain-containing protein [Nannocystaceae bacterium ST9]
MERTTRSLWLTACSLLLPGCYVGVDPADQQEAGDEVAESGTDAGSEDGTGDGDGDPALETTRFPRLSHRQWENTVQDLFRLDAPTGFSSLFIGDPQSGKFDNTAADLDVTQTLWSDYQRAAEQVAELITGSPDLLSRIVPDDLPDDPGDPSVKAKAWIEQFGARAYRRPLTPDEVEAHWQVFVQGVDLYDELDDFTAGVNLSLQVFLQSPHFLYRVEDGSEPNEDGLIPLDGYELASKLSYMLWNSMPDDELFAAAAAGELDDSAGVLVQAARLIDDPRAHATITDFHAQLLDHDHYLDLFKDAATYPEFDPEIMGPAMQQETQAFIDAVVFADEGGLSELLTEPFTYVNADIAWVYGLEESYGDEFVRVELDASRRSGILTQLGFLAANAYAVDPDPIHRGVHTVRNLLCAALPNPPDNVPPLPPPVAGTTNRERVDAHTGEGTCGAGCHSTIINPVGFAFEHYDAIGAWRDLDNGLPIDASGQFALDFEIKTYADAVEFGQLAAASPQVHACYVGHLIEYAWARDTGASDFTLIDDLAARSAAGELSIRQMLLELTQAQGFLTRPPTGAN